MKCPVELNSLFSKFFCYNTWFVISPDQTRHWMTCNPELYVKLYYFVEAIKLSGLKITNCIDTQIGRNVATPALYQESDFNLAVTESKCQWNKYKSYEKMKVTNSSCVKSVQIRSFFGSVFSHIRNEYSVPLRIQPEYGKIYGPEKTPYLETFHAVRVFRTTYHNNSQLLLFSKGKLQSFINSLYSEITASLF